MPAPDPVSGDGDRFARERLAGYSEELLDQPVLLVGAGALGGALALQLAMWGFREGLVVDHDGYELSNATRALDFPYARVSRGEGVSKATEIAKRWRRRVRSAGGAARVRALVGYAQEVPPAAWRRAAVVLGAVDHPRARLDVARLARRYGKPLITGGFDATLRAVTVQLFPGEPAAACYACVQTSEPSYAASDTSCTAFGRRQAEARKVPATPTMAAATAALMMQRLVDGLQCGFGRHAATTQLYLAATAGRAVGGEYLIERNPDCDGHAGPAITSVRLRGRTLGAVLRGLAVVLPGAALELMGALPVHAPTDDGRALVRVALPPWRCPSQLEAGAQAAAPQGAYPLALPTLNLAIARRYGLDHLPAAWFGLAPGAIFDLIPADGERVRCEWAGAGSGVVTRQIPAVPGVPSPDGRTAP